MPVERQYLDAFRVFTFDRSAQRKHQHYGQCQQPYYDVGRVQTNQRVKCGSKQILW